MGWHRSNSLIMMVKVVSTVLVLSVCIVFAQEGRDGKYNLRCTQKLTLNLSQNDLQFNYLCHN